MMKWRKWMVFKPQRSAESIAVVFVKRCNEVYLPLYLPSTVLDTYPWCIEMHSIEKKYNEEQENFLLSILRSQDTYRKYRGVQSTNTVAEPRCDEKETHYGNKGMYCPSFKQFLAQVLLFACTIGWYMTKCSSSTSLKLPWEVIVLDLAEEPF